MDSWYVIQTKSRKEEEVASYLSTKRVEILSPLIEAFLMRNGGMTKGLRPLFPTYIFGKFDVEKDYPLVRWARGVRKVLGSGGYPIPVCEEVVVLIKEKTDENGIVRRTRHFEPNALVRIKTGPLKDLSGVFEGWVSDGERIRILLNLIGYQPTVDLHYSMVEAVA